MCDRAFRSGKNSGMPVLSAHIAPIQRVSHICSANIQRINMGCAKCFLTYSCLALAMHRVLFDFVALLTRNALEKRCVFADLYTWVIYTRCMFVLNSLALLISWQNLWTHISHCSNLCHSRRGLCVVYVWQAYKEATNHTVCLCSTLGTLALRVNYKIATKFHLNKYKCYWQLATGPGHRPCIGFQKVVIVGGE